MVKRKTYVFRKGEVIDVEELHDGRYGAPGTSRIPKRKLTPDQMAKVNLSNKFRKCRHRLLEYFDAGDIFATWTYEVHNRPPDMAAAQEDFRTAMKRVKREFTKRGYDLFWIRNIEQGTKGAWHIHLVIKQIGDTASIITRAWSKGATYVSTIKLNDKIYDEDFTKLASYLTKNEKTPVFTRDGKPAKPRIRQASYQSSRNMPLKEPETKRVVYWKQEPKPKKGYYIAAIHESINPVTGYPYRRYTMIKLKEGGARWKNQRDQR